MAAVVNDFHRRLRDYLSIGIMTNSVYIGAFPANIKGVLYYNKKDKHETDKQAAPTSLFSLYHILWL